jgi:hypothetical protein
MADAEPEEKQNPAPSRNVSPLSAAGSFFDEMGILIGPMFLIRRNDFYMSNVYHFITHNERKCSMIRLLGILGSGL